ncbi:hypothetical protein QAD02_007550 [Eretmocerus hayati]|uniref:Uncharacterized protein n=1 Tax=Eretmocerus hayati TaxID=131215 RepID=A0ACC2N407_9HYME|nr:hypothetical protein QAD02_007550 [Eretmocerus hayati]
MESFIIDTSENMEIAQDQENGKVRNDTINELTWEQEETERRVRRNKIIILGLRLREQNIREQIQGWMKEKIEIDVVVIRCWEIEGRENAIDAGCEKGSKRKGILMIKKNLEGSDKYIDEDLTNKE